jgi:hypothetical protein
MKKIILMLLLITTVYSAELGWSHDYNATLQKAKKSDKQVYVLITSQTCRWCRKFEDTTLQDKAIQDRLYKEFEVVHLRREKDFIPKYFKTSPVPRHYFVDKNAKILYNSLGHRKVECFDSFMDNAHNRYKINK